MKADDLEGATTTAKLNALAKAVEQHEGILKDMAKEFAATRIDIRQAFVKWSRFMVALAVSCTAVLAIAIAVAVGPR